MWLSDTIRIVGVGVGLLGAFVTAPEAFQRPWKRVRDWVVRWSARLIPLLRRDRNVHIAVGGTMSAIGGLAMAVSSAPRTWDATALVAEQLDELRARVDELFAASTTLRNECIGRTDMLRQDVVARLDEQRHVIDEQARAAVAAEQRRIRLDQDGLPIIAAGILLTGWPDPLLWTPLAAVLLVLGALCGWRGWFLLARYRAERESAVSVV